VHGDGRVRDARAASAERKIKRAVRSRARWRAWRCGAVRREVTQTYARRRHRPLDVDKIILGHSNSIMYGFFLLYIDSRTWVFREHIRRSTHRTSIAAARRDRSTGVRARHLAQCVSRSRRRRRRRRRLRHARAVRGDVVIDVDITRDEDEDEDDFRNAPRARGWGDGA